MYMAIEKTYAMIKPDAVKNGNIGKIIARIEEEGFNILGLKMMQMTQELAKLFYDVLAEKPFYGDLIEFITSGPVVAMVLEKDGAIKAWRDLMGATNPADAAENTLRKRYGASIDNNAVHGSDGTKTAETEIKLIFPEL